MTAEVTIGVPVYRGARFVVAALESIQRQTHRALRVIVSLDGPEPESEALCAPFLADPRFRMVVQPRRLGWVAHVNWMMSRVETPFWCTHPQDDVLDPRYLEALVEHAQRVPQAAVVYCDLVAFGEESWTMAQPTVTGSAAARQLALLCDHLPAVAFRGLTRAPALRLAGGIPKNDAEDFCVDAAWMAALARWGDLERVPAALYHKRYHPENTHTRWVKWPRDVRARAWLVHCADMLAQAMQVPATPPERRLLWLAAVARLVALRWSVAFEPSAIMTPEERLRHVGRFIDHLRAARGLDLPGWLDATWEEIQRLASVLDCLPRPGSAAP